MGQDAKTLVQISPSATKSKVHALQGFRGETTYRVGRQRQTSKVPWLANFYSTGHSEMESQPSG